MNDRKVSGSLVDELVASVVLPRPLFKLVPAPAHSNLTDAGLGNPTLGGVARCIVGVADDVLAQRVDAMNHVAPRPTLRHTLPELHERDVDCSLIIRQ